MPIASASRASWLAALLALAARQAAMAAYGGTDAPDGRAERPNHFIPVRGCQHVRTLDRRSVLSVRAVAVGLGPTPPAESVDVTLSTASPTGSPGSRISCSVGRRVAGVCALGGLAGPLAWRRTSPVELAVVEVRAQRAARGTA
jgi:hypothetical protein